MGNYKIILPLLLLLASQIVLGQVSIDTRKLSADSVIIRGVLQLPPRSYDVAVLNGATDSIYVNVIGGMNPNAKILVSWHGVGFLGELGIRNRSPSGFTIFSNTDELNNIEVIYIILDNKIKLP